jgi:hypothetical protein
VKIYRSGNRKVRKQDDKKRYSDGSGYFAVLAG